MLSKIVMDKAEVYVFASCSCNSISRNSDFIIKSNSVIINAIFLQLRVEKCYSCSTSRSLIGFIQPNMFEPPEPESDSEDIDRLEATSSHLVCKVIIVLGAVHCVIEPPF